jgi:hypothetical protein
MDARRSILTLVLAPGASETREEGGTLLAISEAATCGCYGKTEYAAASHSNRGLRVTGVPSRFRLHFPTMLLLLNI